MTENLAWDYAELGRLWLGIDRKKSEASYQKSLEAYADFPLGLEGLGKIAAAKGDLDQALANFQKAFDTLPLPQFAARISEIYAKKGNQDKAAIYQKLVEIGYQSIAAKGSDTDLEWAEFLAFHGLDPDRALALARSAYDKRPNIFAADTLAWVLYQKQQLTEAEKFSDLALRTNSKNSLIRHHSCMITRAVGKKTRIALCKPPLLEAY